MIHSQKPKGGSAALPPFLTSNDMTILEFREEILREIKLLRKDLKKASHIPLEDSEKSEIDGARAVLDWLKEYIKSIKI